jgi:hypothetical protein
VLRADREALEHEELLEPEENPGTFSLQVNVAERREAVLVERLRRQVVVAGAGGQGEREGGVTLVENEDLGPRITEELSLEERDESALACPGGADDEGMPDVSGVQIETEGCRAPGGGPEESRRTGGKKRIGGDGLAGPDGRRRRDIGAVLRGEERPADIWERMPGEAAMKRGGPGFRRRG